MTLVIRTRALDGPIELVSALPSRSGGPRSLLLHGEDGIVASGVAARIPVGTGPERLRRAREELARLARASAVEDEVRVAGTGLVAMGSFTFDPCTEGSILTIPRVLIGRRDGIAWRTEISAPGAEARTGGMTEPPIGDPDRVRFGGSTVPDGAWLRAVAVALERIHAGGLEKVVLARDQLLWSRRPFDTDALVARLHERFTGCHVFAVDGLVGASPELLLGKRGLDVRSRVLAGTAARGRGPDDHRLGSALLESEKDRREHALAVASVRDALAPVCVRLDVPTAPEILRLPNVQHLATLVA
ncbi:MAG: chorismate-binding protein, partial [Planctomycetota bacterium]